MTLEVESLIANSPSSPTPRGVLALLLVVALLPASGGCAWFRAVPPGFDTVSIQVEVERDKQGNVDGDLEAYSTLKGMLVGAITGGPTFAIAGGAGGFALGVWTCAATGPFIILYPVCVAALTVIGFVGGFAVGLVGGVTMGAIGGLPSEVADEITAVLAKLEEHRSFDEDFLAAMQRAIPKEKQVDGATAMATVTARFDEIDLRQHSGDRVSLRLWASMVQTWVEDGKEEESTCKYRYDSERKEATTWLADGGVSFGEAARQGLETFARWMNRDLEAFAAETELDDTEEDPDSCFQEKHWYTLWL